MQLNEVIKGLEITWMKGGVHLEIAAMTSDLARVRPGSLFFALENSGIEFQVELALERGAAAIVTEREFVPNRRATLIQTSSMQKAMAVCAANFFGTSGAKIAVIGVTGSSLSQNFAPALKQTLALSGLPTGFMGVGSVEAGERLLPGMQKPSNPIEAHAMLAEMIKADCRACVYEAPEKEMAEARGLGFPFHAMARVASENDWRGKEQEDWFSQLPETPNNILAIYPERNAETCRDKATTLLITAGERMIVSASDLVLDQKKTSFYLHLGESVSHCESKLIGRSSVHHLLAAAGTACALKARPALVAGALGAVKPAGGNLERIPSNLPFEVFVDPASSPLALHRILADLREVAPKARLLAVCGAPAKTSPRFRAMLGQAAAAQTDYLVITSDNPASEDPQQICEQIAEGLPPSTEFVIVLDRDAAIRHASRQARPGDVVLVAGKGISAIQALDSTIVPFDDRVQARQALEAAQARQGGTAPRSKRRMQPAP
jgi:UDP-N-acetylmuramoyl-L-alanyl-D-glutamate--2,6-diaminopimelate ligase